MDRDQDAKRILGQSLHDKVSSSHVLLVGAGGIGCELLKNLVLSGFHRIDVIDLDTIDISNLNRQFLFQMQHVKKAKAHVAKESALAFNPSVQIESHQANIKDPKYTVEWFKQFTLVFNALDNLDARRHVNALCLAADVALVETGTTGYLGQAYVIQKGFTECFDCQPKETPKTYPVCTIRSTPSAPIHCIVWSKSYLFSQLFGIAEEDEIVQDESDDNRDELAALARETEELMEIRSAMGSDDYPRKVFDKVFKKDIERLLLMESMWKHRKPPIPLDFEQLEQKSSQLTCSSDNESTLNYQQVWTLEKCFQMFKQSTQQLCARLQKAKLDDPTTSLSFDKDDDDALDFVTATANLRAHMFGIPQKSRFQVKSMAGNIIPAIATTNAVIAGIAVMNAFRVLGGEQGTIKRSYLVRAARQRPLLVLEEPSKPNLECSVCQSSYVTVHVDFERARVRDLLEKVITVDAEAGGAGLTDEVTIMHGSRIIYDVDLDANVDKRLEDLGIHSGSIVRVSPDDGDDFDLILLAATEQDKNRIIYIDTPFSFRRPKNDQVELGQKRPRDSQDDVEAVSPKRPLIEREIMIEEDEDGVIVL